MDYSPLLKPVLQLWWLIPIIVLLGVLKLPAVKGFCGEALVRLASRLRLSKDIYRSFHNVTLQTPDGTTQIDHVIVSPFGIFVIETKNMKGWIFGGEQAAQWTQNIFGKSYKFQNPLRQNYKHVKALEATLDVSPDVIHSIVVFSGECVFKTAMPANVVQGGGFVRFIKSFQYQVFSDDQVKEMSGLIETGRLPPTLATRRQHSSNLQTRQDPAAERACARCGSRMVIRIAKSGRNAGGKFWGCSSYPRCKAVQSAA